ncbi:MAG: M23 family metallopeptidase [Burkholderiaceae bacterium]
MQIILVHQRLAQARTYTLTTRHVVLAVLALGFSILSLAAILNYVTLRTGSALNLPGVRALIEAAGQTETERKDRYVHENIDAMAVKLGEMQAQLMRLEALAERVSGLAGISPDDFKLHDPPPRGGATPTSSRELSLEEFQAQLDSLASGMERRADYLNVVESALMDSKLKSKMMPTSLPVNVEYNSSGFGPRLDPFTGKLAMHEGVDFVASPGTPIVAAAGGVVITAEWNHDFGNLIEIDHGNDITTLYGHTSRVYVHVGDIVRRNQHIADVGSTGRATGPHLHFEVHVRGVPQNPTKFLESGGAHQLARAEPELSVPAREMRTLH